MHTIQKLIASSDENRSLAPRIIHARRHFNSHENRCAGSDFLRSLIECDLRSDSHFQHNATERTHTHIRFSWWNSIRKIDNGLQFWKSLLIFRCIERWHFETMFQHNDIHLCAFVLDNHHINVNATIASNNNGPARAHTHTRRHQQLNYVNMCNSCKFTRKS